MKLNKQQKTFCEEYVKNGYNGSKAYKMAYGQENKNHAAVGASQLLQKDVVRDYIDQIEGSYRIVGYQEGITKSEMLRVYKEMLYATKKTPTGEEVADWTARHNAVQGIAKLLGDLTEKNKIELEDGKKGINLDEMTDEEKEAYRKELLEDL